MNRPLDRPFLRPLGNGGEHRAADQIATIQHLVLSAAEPDGQQPVLIAAPKDGFPTGGHRRLAGFHLLTGGFDARRFARHFDRLAAAA